MDKNQFTEIQNINDENIEMDNNIYHEINLEAKNFYKKCFRNNVPVFISYYIPNKGYQYRTAFPEEIGTEEVASQYGKFKKFLQICIDFNKKDYEPQIQNRK